MDAHQRIEPIQQELPMAPLAVALRAVGPAPRDMSLVEVVLLACDVSEDEGEVNDVVDGLVRSGAARLLPAHEDAMLRRLDASPSDLAA